MQNNLVKLTGEELKVLLESGFVLREASSFAKAEKVFVGCAELMPESEVPLVGLATVFLQKGDYEKAENICRDAVAKNESSPYARLHLGEALLFNKKREEAQRELTLVIKGHPGTTFAETAQHILQAGGLE